MSGKPKKPDAFVAMVFKQCGTSDGLIPAREARYVTTSLLRRYHARVRRAVKEIQRQTIVQEYADDPKSLAYQFALKDVLAALDRIKKGIR